MEDAKGSPGLPTAGWSARPSSDAGSDKFLLRDSSTSKYLKICVAVGVVAVVIATGIGLALFFTLNRVVKEEEEILDNLVQQEDKLTGLENTQEERVDEVEALKVRLVGGLGDSQGRVSVMVDDAWGTICSKNWTDAEARAVCRSMGYRTGTAVPSSVHGPGFGNIALSDVLCPEGSDSLDMCEFSIAHHECSHLHDVAVTCTGDIGDAEPAAFHGNRWRYWGWRDRRRRICRGCVRGYVGFFCLSPRWCFRRIGSFLPLNRLRPTRCFNKRITTTVPPTVELPSTTPGPSVPDPPFTAALSKDGAVRISFDSDNPATADTGLYVQANEDAGYDGFSNYLTYSLWCNQLSPPI